MGELLVPEDELGDDWREGLAQIARRTYRSFMRHPWTFEFIGGEDDPGVGGPNALRHVEQSLMIAERTGLDLKGQFEITALMDDFVFGHAMRTRGIGRSNQAPKERLDAVIAYMETAARDRRVPAAAGDRRRRPARRLRARVRARHRSGAFRARPPGRARRDRADAAPRRLTSNRGRVPLGHAPVRHPASVRRRPRRRGRPAAQGGGRGPDRARGARGAPAQGAARADLRGSAAARRRPPGHARAPLEREPRAHRAQAVGARRARACRDRRGGHRRGRDGRVVDRLAHALDDAARAALRLGEAAVEARPDVDRLLHDAELEVPRPPTSAGRPRAAGRSSRRRR